MPDWRSEIRRRLQGASLAPAREAEIASEIGQHLEDRYQSLLACGQPPADAERQGWRELEGAKTLTMKLRPVESATATNLAGREAPRGTPPLAGLRLLDAGCWTGRRLRRTAAALAVGVDVSPEMLDAGLL